MSLSVFVCNSALSVTPRRDISRVVSYYVDTIVLLYFILFILPWVCYPGFNPIIIYIIGNFNNIKQFSIKRHIIKTTTQGL